MELSQVLQRAIDQKTKPPGSLGQLEALALQMGCVQKSSRPTVDSPTIVVFAGDHGAASAGVSSYPQEVTYQMVMNFLGGGAAINVFCRENTIDLAVVDAGVNFDFVDGLELIDAKIAKGTQNYLQGPAMSAAQLEECFARSSQIVDDLAVAGCNVLGLGDMGIGNSASASLIMSVVCELPLVVCTGRGAGASDAQLQKKVDLLETARGRYPVAMSAREALQVFGGFEIAQMCGAMLAAYQRGMIILIDGFIATAAYLVAHTLEPGIASHSVFCHRSEEQGHHKMLEYLGARPVLDLSMRLGEGTGCALVVPLLRCAVGFLNDMASFDSAGVVGGNASC